MGVGTGLAVDSGGVRRFAVRGIGLRCFGVVRRNVLGAVLVSSSVQPVADLNEALDNPANGANAKLDLLASAVLEVSRGLS